MKITSMGKPFHFGEGFLKLIMRTFVFLFCSICFALSPNKGLSQDADIIIEKGKIMNVKQAFKLINKQTDYKFGYRSDLLKNAPELFIERGTIKAGTLLNRFLSPISFMYEFTENKIILVKKKPGTVEDGIPPSNTSTVDQFQVSGSVTDVDGQPLPGASIVEKGTTNGTQTDFDGNFILNTANADAILVISYIGFTTKEISLEGRTSITVSLVENTEGLDEVVVVGYGTQKRSDLTGAVSSISQEKLEYLPLQSLDQALQGQAAGVQVKQTSGAPGGGISVRIRGSNSITGSSEPLYVIDGLPVSNDKTNGSTANSSLTRLNPLSALNPGDIESIEILKDASATAIYGARGANGVVIITTKKGKAGKSSVTFESYHGIQTVANRMDLLNAEQWLTTYQEAADNSEGTIADDIQKLFGNGVDIDYQDEIFRDNALIQNYQLGLSGGTEDGLHYLLSLNYFSQEGLVKKTGFDRYTTRINIDKQINKVKLGANVSLSYLDTQVPSEGIGHQNSVVSGIFQSSPARPIYLEDGVTFNPDIIQQSFPNPVVQLLTTDDAETGSKIFGNVFAEVELAKGLRFKTQLGGDLETRKRKYFSAANGPIGRTSVTFGGNSNGRAEISHLQVSQLVHTNQLDYAGTFGGHNLNVTGVFEYQTEKVESFLAGASDFAFGDVALGNLGSAANQESLTATSGGRKSQLTSLMGRINYGFKSKYLLTFTLRTDGSSKFGANNRWGTFPSIGLAWNAHEEKAIKDLNLFNTLKFRGSYGQTGNQEIGIGNSQAQITDRNVIFSDNSGTQSERGGAVTANIPNPDLKWETTTQISYGLDASFFKGRLSVTADYYDKSTTDLLLSVPVPLNSGFRSVLRNVGEVQNKGYEIGLNATIVDNDNFSWNLGGNISSNKNEVIEIGENPSFRSPVNYFASMPGGLVREGEPIGLFEGWVTDGLDENGDLQFVDQNDDGIINAEDDVIIGNPHPDFFYGITNNMTYKNFELSMFFSGVQGNDVLFLWARNLTYQSAGQSLLSRFENRFPGGSAPRYIQSPPQLTSSIYSDMVYDGSYFRLQNVTLAYNLPVDNIDLFSSGKIYLSAQNLFTITDYPGYNPEANNFNNNNINIGADRGGYPLARTFLLGLQFGF